MLIDENPDVVKLFDYVTKARFIAGSQHYEEKFDSWIFGPIRRNSNLYKN